MRVIRNTHDVWILTNVMKMNTRVIILIRIIIRQANFAQVWEKADSWVSIPALVKTGVSKNHVYSSKRVVPFALEHGVSVGRGEVERMRGQTEDYSGNVDFLQRLRWSSETSLRACCLAAWLFSSACAETCRVWSAVEDGTAK